MADRENSFATVRVGPGILYHYLPVTRWKTLSIDVVCMAPLRRDTVTELAVVPRLAKRGTAKFPSLMDLARHLDGMYGASLSADTSKIGPAQVVRFGLDVPSLPGQSLGKAMALIWDLAAYPYLENGGYPRDRFDTEREEQERDILSIINNRPRYASIRLIEEISKGNDSSLPAWGVLSDLPGLDPLKTWDTWQNVLAGCNVSIYAIGDGAKELAGILERASLEFPRGRSDDSGRPLDAAAPPIPTDPVDAEESLPGEQTVLCMAFHTGVTESDPRLPTATVYDGILGGFTHSKLFANVREKHMMAYFADSALNSWRGLVTATAGIMDENRDRVIELVKEQVDALKKGEISDAEMDNTKAGLIRRYRAESDMQSALVRRFLTREIMGGPATEDELVSRVRAVTKDDVVTLAQDVKYIGSFALRATQSQEDE